MRARGSRKAEISTILSSYAVTGYACSSFASARKKCALFVWGGFWALWGFRTLGVHVSQGHESELIDAGAYRYCRNPQYIGSIAVFAGYALICNSSLTLIASGLAAVVFTRTPFAEEPWLRERLGAAYDDYCARVPRFLPSRSGASRDHSGA